MANDLIESCFSNSCINFKEKETLHTYDPKKSITICKFILTENGLESEFNKVINKSLEPNHELIILRNIYLELHGLRGLYITTNVDNCFHNKFEQFNIVYKEHDLKRSISDGKIDKSKLYQIHGSLLGPNTLVFTVSDYLKKYQNEQLKSFMKTLFSTYTVLFVGYGLEEFEILDYLISKFDYNEGTEVKHFLLQPYFRSESHILKFDRVYYRSLGITILPYEKDEKGYNPIV